MDGESMKDEKMKLLMLAGTQGLLRNTNRYNGGGWVASLQREIMRAYSRQITISLAFPSERNFHEEYDGVDYYGIEQIKYAFWKYQQKEKAFCDRIKKVIDSVQPDVILCFGTENGLGLACTVTKVPVIIHLQGILNPYYEAWMPQGLSWNKWLWGNKGAMLTWLALKEFKKREMKMFHSCKYFLGRTEWDKGICNLLAPQAHYFYCSEMLRPEIYNSVKSWSNPNNRIKRIISIISGSIYKGGDVVLRAAQILKDNAPFDFVWEMYGLSDIRQWEALTNIRHEQVNVEVKGVINAQQLVDRIMSADVYVHPSYIENSPNTVCEAQLLGIPVIATDTGGTSTLVEHRKTGLLVPVNEPYLMAADIIELINSPELSVLLGKNARSKSLERHSPSHIVSNLMSILSDIKNEYHGSL